MTEVAFVVHPGREAAAAAAEGLCRALAADGAGVTMLDEEQAAPGAFDLVVSVGGDGTFLRAAHVAFSTGCPVLGVKVGRMGFLTEVEPDQAEPLIRRVLEGTARIEDRLAVTAEPEGSGSFRSQWALNEVMVEKHARHRLVRLLVSVDGAYVATFSADGVIVATPTGSTAYSFAARGPIVTPSVNCLVLTPIAAHMVFDRSFVLDAEQRVTIEVVGEEMGMLSADGRESIELPVGSRIAIRAADRPARLVRRDDAPGFLSLVREKFGLPGEPDGPGVGGDG
ncbi:MAG: NAD(+)/NADH kinase [Actinobacteria bacterium]|nr:NAD(+)/NADH kinase [Actinomycetota bacterium]